MRYRISNESRCTAWEKSFSHTAPSIFIFLVWLPSWDACAFVARLLLPTPADCCFRRFADAITDFLRRYDIIYAHIWCISFTVWLTTYSSRLGLLSTSEHINEIILFTIITSDFRGRLSIFWLPDYWFISWSFRTIMYLPLMMSAFSWLLCALNRKYWLIFCWLSRLASIWSRWCLWLMRHTFSQHLMMIDIACLRRQMSSGYWCASSQISLRYVSIKYWFNDAALLRFIMILIILSRYICI